MTSRTGTVNGCEPKRVVITGMGLVTALGSEIDAFWRNITAGKSGVSAIEGFDAAEYATRFAAEIKDFQADRYMERREARKMDRFVQFAVAASTVAVSASGLEITEANAARVGVLIGSGVGGLHTIEEQYRVMA